MRGALALACLLGGPAAARAACTADPDLAYVCDADRPEDLVAMPGERWLIASGFAPGAGLKLVDRPARTLSRLYDGDPARIAFDRVHYPACPGPLDPALFNARGLSLRASAPGHWRLLVVNHGGRQSVEAFDVTLEDDRPRLTWRGCLPMPKGQVGNAVASFADGAVLVTVLTRPGTSIADFMQGRNTGAVWQWRPGDDRFRELAGTELPGDNGLEVDPDDHRFYVVAFGWHALLAFDRANTRHPLWRFEAPDFMPDNVHWSGGHLLLAGMRLDEPACGGLRMVANGVADPMLCHRGWIVGEVNFRTRRIATLAYGGPQGSFNGLSSAVIAGGELWLGSYQSDRLAVVRAWSPPVQGAPRP